MAEQADYDILYSSYLLKRNKSHNWQKKWFVLRRNQLSYYKDSTEYKASKVLSIDEILSFNEIPDGHKWHFIIVTGSKIYHLKALDSKSYYQWLEILNSIINKPEESQDSEEKEKQQEQIKQVKQIKEINKFEFKKPTIDSIHHDFTNLQLSGTDDNFTSDAGVSRNTSNLELNHLEPPIPSSIPEEPENIIEEDEVEEILEQQDSKESSYYNSFASTSPDHIISKGYLFRLKKRYNQWKKYYIILTNHFLFFFKSVKDAESNKIYKKINVSDILDAVELDPLSRSRLYCMLIITPLKRIRFCAESEEELTKWLVLLKAIVKTRKQEREKLIKE